MAKYFIRKTAAFIAAFSLLGAVATLGATSDRHDAAIQRTDATTMQDKAAATERENDAQWAAMEARQARGDFGEVRDE